MRLHAITLSTALAVSLPQVAHPLLLRGEVLLALLRQVVPLALLLVLLLVLLLPGAPLLLEDFHPQAEAA